MIIETKYNLGDFLFPISRGVRSREIACTFCGGGGFIKGAANQSRPCPDCYGRRTTTITEPEQWLVGSMYEVRRIEAHRCTSELCEENDSWPTRYMRIIYMAAGSGTMWDETRLFPSRDEAQAECDRLNTADIADNVETVT